MSKAFYSVADEIDAIVARGYSDGSTNALNEIISKGKEYESYFLRKVRDISWLVWLKKQGYFLPVKNPAPKTSDQEGYYVIPEWNILPYIERISQQVNLPGNEQYIDELLEIIKSVSTYQDVHGKHIDNYRTWSYFVKVLLNIPNEKIPIGIIELVPIWLDSTFKTSLQGADIARKLLPKFLNSNNPEDWVKAEKIGEIITNIKWSDTSQRHGKKIKEEYLVTLIEPYWLVESFEENGLKIGEKCSSTIIYVLANRIKDIFKKKNESKSHGGVYEGREYRITLTPMPDTFRHEISVELLIYPEGRQIEIYEDPQAKQISKFAIEAFANEEQFIATVKGKLIADKFSKLKDEFDKALSYLCPLNFYDYSYIWFESLDLPANEMRSADAERVLVYILREILLGKARTAKNETREILHSFVGHEYPYPLFKRFIVYVASKYWEAYKDIYWGMIKDSKFNYFENPHFEPELSLLLRNNLVKFTPSEKEEIRAIIDAGPKDVEATGERANIYTAYWKIKWLSLLKEDSSFSSAYEEQRKISGLEKEDFSFTSEVTVVSGFGQSLLTAEEILNLSNDELARKLTEFKEEGREGGSTVAALAESLKEAAKLRPEKFTENLEPFKNSGFVYVYEILSGINGAWNQKKNIDWDKLLKFIDFYISRSGFWEDRFVVVPGEWLSGADHLWVVGVSAELIQDGTRTDDWAFSGDYLEAARRIVFLILDGLKAEERKEIKDYVSYTLNTSSGKTITAFIYLALRQARLNDQRGIKTDYAAKWPPEMREKYDLLLQRKVIEAVTNLGRYLPSLFYLDSAWVKTKIEDLFLESDGYVWEAFMQGYLSVGRVYDELYKIMKQHYERGIGHKFKDDHAGEYLLQHIAIGYLRGNESLGSDDSLFRKILVQQTADEIKAVIGFFWSQEKYFSKKTPQDMKSVERILVFWRWLFEKLKVKSKLEDGEKKILSELGKLAVFLPQIDDENFEWLMSSAPYVHVDYDSPFFIEYLDEIKDKGDTQATAKFIGKLFLAMLDSFTPDYDQKHIRSIVEFLYMARNEVDANKISNIYGARGFEFLRDIYEKHSAIKTKTTPDR